MEAKIKCSCCGGTELSRCLVWGSCYEGSCRFESETTYACNNCGHIEWFLNTSYLVKQDDERLAESARVLAEKEKKEQQIRRLESEINALQALIRDENQRVKTVNEAKDKLTRLKEELRSLGNAPKSL
ncbi:MAG: hypothetical protein FWE53_02565 [Firmicutes bacterium]|nr:hypothetical protein [Bacillota bacterium]